MFPAYLAVILCEGVLCVCACFYCFLPTFPVVSFTTYINIIPMTTNASRAINMKHKALLPTCTYSVMLPSDRGEPPTKTAHLAKSLFHAV